MRSLFFQRVMMLLTRSSYCCMKPIISQNVILGTSSNKTLRGSEKTSEKDASLLNSWISNLGSRMTNFIILQWWCWCVPFKILSKFRYTESRIFEGWREESSINIKKVLQEQHYFVVECPQFLLQDYRVVAGWRGHKNWWSIVNSPLT